MTPTGVGAASFRTPAPPARLSDLPPYPLQDVPEIKARLVSEGRDVINLGAGDSRLPIPDMAVGAWIRSRFGQSVDPERFRVVADRLKATA